MGYWTPWAIGGGAALPPSAIEWAGLTHIVYWGGLVQPDGSLDLTTQRVTTVGPTLIAAAHAHGVKVQLGILQGNWLGQNVTFQPAITNNLSNLVYNVMNAVNTYGFDGVDVDWEPFDRDANGPAMKQLAPALRAQLGSRVLTTTVISNDYTYWGSVQSYFDRLEVMTYDLDGLWNPYSWHTSALYGPSDQSVLSVDLIMQRFTAYGTPASKLSIGIPFYGWQWNGGGINGPRQYWSSAPNRRLIYYHNLTINSQNYNWDSLAQVPYLINNNGSPSYFTYDNPQSITAKVNYAKNKGLGGWFIWELPGDYLPGQTPSEPLLHAIANAMGSGASTPLPVTTSPTGGTTSTGTTDLFAIWKMDDAGGSIAYDLTGHNNNATLLNAPSWLSGSNCVYNGCLYFNGHNQSGVANLNLSDTSIVTVAFWMEWDTFSNNDALAMESTPNFNNSATGFMIDPNSSQGNGTAFEVGFNGNAGYNQVLFARPSQGAWHHYTFLFNTGAPAATQVTPYVDGVEVSYTKFTSAQNSNNFGSNPLYFMSRTATSLFGAGRIDDVRIYKRALSNTEIKALATP